MIDLASHDLAVRTCHSDREEEQRLELRIASTGSFVAWFQTNLRLSDGEQVTSASMQIVHLAGLSDEQVNAAKGWVRDQVLAAI